MELKHDNIIYLIDVQKPPERIGFEDIFIITDLSKQELTNDLIKYFAYQISKNKDGENKTDKNNKK